MHELTPLLSATQTGAPFPLESFLRDESTRHVSFIMLRYLENEDFENLRLVSRATKRVVDKAFFSKKLAERNFRHYNELCQKARREFGYDCVDLAKRAAKFACFAICAICTMGVLIISSGTTSKILLYTINVPFSLLFLGFSIHCIKNFLESLVFSLGTIGNGIPVAYYDIRVWHYERQINQAEQHLLV